MGWAVGALGEELPPRVFPNGILGTFRRSSAPCGVWGHSAWQFDPPGGCVPGRSEPHHTSSLALGGLAVCCGAGRDPPGQPWGTLVRTPTPRHPPEK